MLTPLQTASVGRAILTACTIFLLSLTSWTAAAQATIDQLCSFNPAARKYVITNTGSNPETFTISAAEGGGSVAKTRTIGPGSSFQFTYEVNGGGNGVLLYHNETVIASKANQQIVCDPDAPILVTNVCHNDPNRRRWEVSNPNSKTLYVRYADVDQNGVNHGWKTRTIYGSGKGYSTYGSSLKTGDYTYLNTYTDDIELFYGADFATSSAAQLNSDHNICQPAAGVSVENVCHRNPNKYRWKIQNYNNHETHIRYHLIDDNGDTTGWKTRILPAKGKGQLVDKGPFGVGDFLFVSTNTRRIEVQYGAGFGSNSTATRSGTAHMCPLEGISITEACAHKPGIHIWKLHNTNDFEVWVKVLNLDKWVYIPKVSSGGQSQVCTHESINTLLISTDDDYTAEVSLNHSIPACPPSPSCEAGYRSYVATNVNWDNTHAQWPNNNSMRLDHFYGHNNHGTLDFEEGSYLTYNEALDTAYIYALATMRNGSMSGKQWEFMLPFGAANLNVTIPKKELHSWVYNTLDISDWKFFIMSPDARGIEVGGNSIITMRTRPDNEMAGLQIGAGGSSKNLKLGASSWFWYRYNNGPELAGDVNIDLKPMCPDPISCEDGYQSAHLSSYAANGHSISLRDFVAPGWNRFHFDDDAYIVYKSGVDAYVYGTVQLDPDDTGNLSPWKLYMSFYWNDQIGPKKEQPHLQPDELSDQWLYYSLDSCARLEEVNGSRVIRLDPHPTADQWGLQIGTNANNKTTGFGFSTWFVWNHEGRSNYGDLNVDMSAICAPECTRPINGCSVTEVISFSQGQRSNGTQVLSDRSDPSKALSAQTNNSVGSFVSLGFGGQIILKMNGAIPNEPGNDLVVYETSYGSPSCGAYPEHADVYGSRCGLEWTWLGNTCLDGTFDLGELDWIQYVKIVDTSNPNHFGGNSDGYDVDGVESLHCRASKKAEDQPSLSSYPNPFQSNFTVTQIAEEDGAAVSVRVFNQTNLVYKGESSVFNNNIHLDLGHLEVGLYIIHIVGLDSGTAHPGHLIDKR